MKLDPAFLNRPLAHRGLHGEGRVENSVSAFAAAIAGGFGIELDVQVSSDGVPVVFHDYALNRLTRESGPVVARTAADLAEITLGKTEDRIRSLDAVLEMVAGEVPVLIEIKDQDGALGRDVGGLSAAVGDVVAGYGGPVAVMSFNPHHVDGLACARGLVTCAFGRADWGHVGSDRLAGLAAMLDYEAVGASFVSHDVADLDSAHLARTKAGGADVLCWTVRSAKAEDQARAVAANVTFEGYTPAPT